MLDEAQQRMLRRAAQEITPHSVINLGIGLPQALPEFIPPQLDPLIHSENGIIGMGGEVAADAANIDLIDAGGRYVSVVVGGAFVDSATSFGLVRRGKLDITFLGAFQVAENGDLANWQVAGKRSVGMGGAMEIARYAKKRVILMRHVNRDGSPKLLKTCSYPLTAVGCVDLVITDLAVFGVLDHRLTLQALAEGVTLDEVAAATEARYQVASKLEVF